MDRRERRQEMRSVIKELKRIQADKDYLSCLKDEEFADIVRKDLSLLEGGVHPNQEIQMRFGKALNILATVDQLEKRLQFLQVGFRSVEK